MLLARVKFKSISQGNTINEEASSGQAQPTSLATEILIVSRNCKQDADVCVISSTSAQQKAAHKVSAGLIHRTKHMYQENIIALVLASNLMQLTCRTSSSKGTRTISGAPKGRI
eukprot:773646-Pelagomonas_calceolata.AAC.4